MNALHSLQVALALSLPWGAVGSAAKPLEAAAAHRKLPIVKGDFVAAFDDVLPPHLFKYFTDEVVAFAARERPEGTASNGLNSRWLDLGLGLPVDHSQLPERAVNRTVLDVVLTDYLAPLALGGKDMPSQYAGMDWWFNWNLAENRLSDQPKNFHHDKSRPHPESGTFCPPPTVSTVFFVRGDGGAISPTTIIDQKLIPTAESPGQMTPDMPAAMAVAFATPNRLVAFYGDRLHGVLFPPGATPESGPPEVASGEDGERLVFIINFHTYDTMAQKVLCTKASISALSEMREGGYSHGMGSSEALHGVLGQLDPEHRSKPVEILRVQRPLPFDKDDDMESMMSQMVPPSIAGKLPEAGSSRPWPLAVITYGQRKPGKKRKPKRKKHEQEEL